MNDLLKRFTSGDRNSRVITPGTVSRVLRGAQEFVSPPGRPIV